MKREIELSLWQRILLKLRGYVYIGDIKKPHWRAPIPHYIIDCPEHGHVKTHPHGFWTIGCNAIPIKVGGNTAKLDCPKCRLGKGHQ